jgi:hypothetical protein
MLSGAYGAGRSSAGTGAAVAVGNGGSGTFQRPEFLVELLGIEASARGGRSATIPCCAT